VLWNRPLKVGTVTAWDLQSFILCLHFLIQIFVLPEPLQFTGGFALLWQLAHAYFAYTYSMFAVWPSVACNWNPGGRWKHANFPDFVCPRTYLVSICRRLAAKWLIELVCIAAIQMQNLHALAAFALQSCQFFCNVAGSINIETKK